MQCLPNSVPLSFHVFLQLSLILLISVCRELSFLPCHPFFSFTCLLSPTVPIHFEELKLPQLITLGQFCSSASLVRYERRISLHFNFRVFLHQRHFFSSHFVMNFHPLDYHSTSYFTCISVFQQLTVWCSYKFNWVSFLSTVLVTIVAHNGFGEYVSMKFEH